MLKAPYANCDACPLRHAPFVGPDGIKPQAKYTIVGESPGGYEVREGRSFVEWAPSGKLLWAVMNRLGVKREDCNVTNATLCAPTSESNKDEIMAAAAVCCSQRLRYELSCGGTSPILVLGKVAREALFEPEPDAEFQTLQNRWTQDKESGRWMLSTWHPAFVLRSPDDAKLMLDGMIKYVKNDPQVRTPPTYTIIESPEQFEAVQWKSNWIAYDIESDQIEYADNNILLVVVADSPNHAYILPGKHPGTKDLVYRTKAHPAWNAFWESDARWFVGHNAKFDNKFLRKQLGWHSRVDEDTMLAHYISDEHKPHDLKSLGARFLDIPDWEAGIRRHLKSRNDLYSKIPWSDLCQYAAQDACATWELGHIFKDILESATVEFGPKKGQTLWEWPFRQIKMREQEMFTDIEMHGTLIDRAYLEEKDVQFEKEKMEIGLQMRTMSDGVIDNPNSPQQVAKYLYDVLHLPAPKGRKVKPRSTNKDVIAQMKDLHPIIPLLKKYRKIEKVHTSYVLNILNALDDWNVLHSDAQLHGAETQRISIQRPATQTLPRKGDSKDPLSEYSKVIRYAFLARLGCKLVICDYSQAELRVAADLSGDPFLLQVFNEGRDLHTEVAIAMFGPNWTKEQRMLCKMFNFSYLYGGTEHSFAADAGLPISVAVDFVKKYDEVMPVLKSWKVAQEQQMRRRGYVPYKTGARRRIPFVNDVNMDEARKASFNSPVQGSASHMTSLSAVRVWEQLQQYASHILLLVHDSIIVEVPDRYVDAVARLTMDTMTSTASEFFPRVKWKADAEVGERWATAAEWSPMHI